MNSSEVCGQKLRGLNLKIRRIFQFGIMLFFFEEAIL